MACIVHVVDLKGVQKPCFFALGQTDKSIRMFLCRLSLGPGDIVRRWIAGDGVELSFLRVENYDGVSSSVTREQYGAFHCVKIIDKFENEILSVAAFGTSTRQSHRKRIS